MARRRKKSFRTPKAVRRQARKRKMGVAERRKREFTYRGHTLVQLQAMPLWAEEGDVETIAIIDLLSARARRSLGRTLSRENEHLLARIRCSGEDDVVRTHRRDMVILPEMVGKNIAIHNGRQFIQVDIQPEMIGGFLGEYALTRKRGIHSGPGVGATRSSKHVALK
jgi:small subunit ribosomal protein S19